MWYQDHVYPNQDLRIWRFSHLVIPTKYPHLTSVTILKLVGWVLWYCCSWYYVLVPICSPIYQSNIWVQHCQLKKIYLSELFSVPPVFLWCIPEVSVEIRVTTNAARHQSGPGVRLRMECMVVLVEPRVPPHQRARVAELRARALSWRRRRGCFWDSRAHPRKLHDDGPHLPRRRHSRGSNGVGLPHLPSQLLPGGQQLPHRAHRTKIVCGFGTQATARKPAKLYEEYSSRQQRQQESGIKRCENWDQCRLGYDGGNLKEARAGEANKMRAEQFRVISGWHHKWHRSCGIEWSTTSKP